MAALQPCSRKISIRSLQNNKTTMTCSSMTPITMSIQPTYGDGGPAWLANKLGYFEELCLNVTLLVYQSGAPQVNEISKWSVGNAGSPPNVQGWTQGVLKTVGIDNDESSTNALVANAEGIASWASILAAGTLGDTRMTINPNSTGEFVVEECLKKYNVSFDPVTNFIYNTTQEGVFSSLSDPDGNDFGSFWAPTLYSAVETWGKESIICSGDDAGAHVAGGLMVSNEADETNTETGALAIAAYLKGVTYFQSYREKSKAYLNEFYVEQGFSPLSPEALDMEFSRPLYNLNEQLQMLAKNEGGASTLGSWFQETVDFMLEGGIIPSRLNAEDYIDDKYMKWIAANETLAKWTMTMEESAPVSPGIPPPTPTPGASEPEVVPTLVVDEPEASTPTPPTTEAPSSGNKAFLVAPIGFAVAVLNYMFM